MDFMRKLFDNNEREVARLRSVVDQINALEPEFEQIPTERLADKTAEFKALIEERRSAARASNDDLEAIHQAEQDALDQVLPQAFALVREASKRTLGMRHFDVQLLGGVVLHQGRIAEMKTGEGKTLVATLPLYLNALLGRGCHLATHNDFLAKRDAHWNGPIYHLLGLNVGVLMSALSSTEEGYAPAFVYDPDHETDDPRFVQMRKIPRRDAYRECDILYGVHSEFGFDYLRDNSGAHSLEEMTQRELYYCLVDEVDSILIDEARTPLIISGIPEESNDQYEVVDRVIARLVLETHYTVDEKAKTAMLNEDGTEHVEQALGVENLAEDVDLMHHVSAALKARYAYKRDVDYVVKDGEVLIVDEQTGRLMFGRRYQDGLHQALEAKEGCKVEAETLTTATVTYQNYMRLYQKIAGMTGTAKTEEAEFRKIYSMDVVVIPTNKPLVRQDHPDIVFKSEEQKFRGIVRELIQMHVLRRPVLVGTRTIEVSEWIAERLLNERLQLLTQITILQNRIWENKSLPKEQKAQYSALMNQKFDTLDVYMLTPASKALGVPPSPLDDANVATLAKILEVEGEEALLKRVLTDGIPYNVLNAKQHEKEAQVIADAGRPGAVTIATNMAGRGVDILLGGNPAHYPDTKEMGEEVRRRGGLHIIGSERHEARRIDNQLRGRAGRQGDSGSSRFYLSLEDYIWRLFGDKGRGLLEATWDDAEPIAAGILSKAIERAQKKVEENNFSIRKHVLEYDDVMNHQRKIIYGERRKVMEGVDLHEAVRDSLAELVRNSVVLHTGEASPEEWDLKGLYNLLGEAFPLVWYAQPEDLSGKKADELTQWLTDIASDAFERREQDIDNQSAPGTFRDLERWVMLRVIDEKWVSHLQAMEYLREGINLRAYAQIDPLVAFKKEAFEYFQELLNNIQRDVVSLLFRVQVAPRPVEYAPAPQPGAYDGESEYAGNGNTAVQTRPTSVKSVLANRQATKRTPQAAQTAVKTGRNDPCPCGSGKKYKRCCGA